MSKGGRGERRGGHIEYRYCNTAEVPPGSIPNITQHTHTEIQTFAIMYIHPTRIHQYSIVPPIPGGRHWHMLQTLLIQYETLLLNLFAHLYISCNIRHYNGILVSR